MKCLVFVFLMVPFVAFGQSERVVPRVDRAMPNAPAPGPVVGDIDPRTGKQNFIPPVRRLPQAHTWTDGVPPLTNEPVILPNIEPHRGPLSPRVREGIQNCNNAIISYRRERARISRVIEVNRIGYGGVLNDDEAMAIRWRVDLEPAPMIDEARYALSAGMYDQCVSLANAARQTINNIVTYALGEHMRR